MSASQIWLRFARPGSAGRGADNRKGMFAVQMALHLPFRRSLAAEVWRKGAAGAVPAEAPRLLLWVLTENQDYMDSAVRFRSRRLITS